MQHTDKIIMSCYALFAAATALVEGKIGKSLKKVLKKVVAKEAHEQLAISDAKLGGIIKVSDMASRAPTVGGRWTVYVSRVDTFFFLPGKAGRDVRAQLGSGRADEVHQEPDGEPHHWTAAPGDERHVFGFGSQVNHSAERQTDRQTAACDYTCCLKFPLWNRSIRHYH